MKLVKRLVYWQFLQNRRLSLFLCFGFSLGSLGLCLADGFRQILLAYVTARQRTLMTADLLLVAERNLLDTETSAIEQILPKPFQKTTLLEFYSMARTDKASRLVRIQAVGANYPLTGEVKLSGSSWHKITPSTGEIWCNTESHLALMLETDSRLYLGDQEFRFGLKIEDEPGSVSSGFSLAPNIFMRRVDLDATKLITKNSRFREKVFYLLPDHDPETLDKNVHQILQGLGKSAEEVQILTPKKARGQVFGVLNLVIDYLGLVALVTFFLSGLGLMYLSQISFLRQLKSVAILSSLGLRPEKAVLVFCLWLMLIGFLASLTALFLASILLPDLFSLLATWLPGGMSSELPLATAVTVSLLTTLSPLLFLGPYLLILPQTNTASLFQDWNQSKLPITFKQWCVFALVFLLLFYILAFYLSQSWLLARIFTQYLALAFLGLMLVGFLFIFVLNFWPFKTGISTLAVQNLKGQKAATIIFFITSGLLCLLANLVPQIFLMLSSELEGGGPEKMPSLFLFDIQPEQISDLENWLRQYGLKLENLSPLIRAQLRTVNGDSFQRTAAGMDSREREREQFLRSRTMNLSVRQQLSSAESIVAGSAFTTSEIQASAEVRFAESIGIKPGDILGLEIQGVEIKTKLVNLRRVRWNSFQPNFFLVLNEGALDGAPASYLAVIRVPETVDFASMQRQLSQAFKNISQVDLRLMAKKAKQLNAQVQRVLSFMCLFTLALVLLVMLLISVQEMERRNYEFNLLAILGSTKVKTGQVLFLETCVLIGSASLVGATFSFIIANALGKMVFDSLQVPDLALLGFSVIILPLGLVSLFLILQRKMIHPSPMQLLRSS